MTNPGKIIIEIGILIVIVGLIIYFWGNKLGWIGHLPGDIQIERENFKFYFPITTMILVSVLLTLLARLFQKIF
jgi:hypothetical protein